MLKGIIVIDDIPQNCFGCKIKRRPAGMSFPEDMVCGITGQSIYQYKPHNTNGNKPDWCPIKPLPKKVHHKEYWDNGRYDKGWNECLEKIEDGG